MPRYDFKCEICEEVVEYNLTLQEHEDLKNKEMTHNDSCNGKMKQTICYTPVHFRGSGWTVKSK